MQSAWQFDSKKCSILFQIEFSVVIVYFVKMKMVRKKGWFSFIHCLDSNLFCPLQFIQTLVSFELNGGWNWKITNTCMRSAHPHFQNVVYWLGNCFCPLLYCIVIIHSIDFRMHMWHTNDVYVQLKGVKFNKQFKYGRNSSSSRKINK